MTPQQNGSALRKPLRLWPGVLFAIVQVVSWFVVPKLLPDYGVYGFFGTILASLAIILWWLFASRVPWPERLGVVLLMVVAVFVTSRFLHISISNGGMFYFLVIPLMTFAFVIAVALTRRLPEPIRRTVVFASVLLACGAFTLVRFGGIYGNLASYDFRWRWSQTPEERMLAAAEKELAAPAAAPAPATSEPAKETPAAKTTGNSAAAATTPVAVAKVAEWPGFRGPNRNSIVPGVQIKTDWSASPPVEMWRRAIGPGWSSFAVSGDLLYTQEQRGDNEVVSCYNMKTGQPVWRHRDAVRFWEPGSGAGPRGTPTLSGGRVYAFGATGILNALDAASGAVIWSRNIASENKKKVPDWGFSSSPLVMRDIVVVAASGQLFAHALATGEPRWTGPVRTGSYSSPHLLTIDSVEQILLLNGAGTISVSPTDGKLLWEHLWSGGGPVMLQPALADNGDLLLTTNRMGGGEGVRRIAVTHEGSTWTLKERWTSRGLKPYFNDFVVHKGHAYGFDGTILSCINLENGERKWKGGRYGNGQLVLLAEQDLLLVISEEGEVSLVSAKPDQFTEIAKIPALEGKTWNHPAVVGDVLLVRNDHEMAAFRLPLAR